MSQKVFCTLLSHAHNDCDKSELPLICKTCTEPRLSCGGPVYGTDAHSLRGRNHHSEGLDMQVNWPKRETSYRHLTEVCHLPELGTSAGEAMVMERQFKSGTIKMEKLNKKKLKLKSPSMAMGSSGNANSLTLICASVEHTTYRHLNVKCSKWTVTNKDPLITNNNIKAEKNIASLLTF